MQPKEFFLLAVFFDFYGTIVHEDGVVINELSQKMFEHWRKDRKSVV